jgi:hypothetical protein
MRLIIENANAITAVAEAVMTVIGAVTAIIILLHLIVR